MKKGTVIYIESVANSEWYDRYEFDLKAKKWTADDYIGHRVGDLTDEAILRFIFEINEAIDNGACSKLTPYKVKITYYNLIIPGILHMHWDSPAVKNYPGLQMVHKALDHMLEGIR